MWCAPACRAARTVSASCSGSSESPGRIGATATLVRMPASTRRRTISSRRRGGAVPGSVVRQTRSSRVGTETLTETSAPSGCLLEHVDVTPDERAARDDRDRCARARELDDARAGEAIATLRRLVRVGSGTDRHLLARPGAAGELCPQHVGDVRLDADRAAVAVVGGPVGPALERPDVTERAAVHAAGVRVERPGERHPLDPVECGAARLFAIGGPHASV